MKWLRMMMTWTNVYPDIDFSNTYRDEISFQPLFTSIIFIFLINNKRKENQVFLVVIKWEPPVSGKY